MALINNAPPPLGDPIAQQTRKEFKPGEDPQAGLCSQPWGDWFSNILGNQEKYPGRIATVTLTDQTANIVTTEIATTEPLTAGLYAIQYYLRLERVDSFAADVQLTFRWTWDGAARNFSGPSIATNTLGETGSAPFMFKIDNNTTITYETQTSFGGADGVYALDIVLSEVNA